MAIGDIAGDLADTYTTRDPRAKQNSFDITNTPAKYLTPLTSQSPPAGPIGRAQQQLPDQPNNLGNIDMTPLDPVSAAQSGPGNLADAFKQPAAPPPAIQSPAAVTPAPVTPPAQQPTNLSQMNLVTPIPAGPQPPPLTNLAQIGSNIGAELMNNPSQAAAPPISPESSVSSGSVARGTSTPVPATGEFSSDPFTKQQQVAGWRAPFTGQPATLTAGATPATPAPTAQSGATAAPTPTPPAQTSATAAGPAAPAPTSLDIYRSTGAGTDATGATRAGGQIVATTGPNGEASFSNAAGAQTAAQNLGDIINNPVPLTTKPGASLASLGSAANLGDGIGTFSQAQNGDAALAMGRFEKAHDLRESYKNQDRLEQALGAQWGADHTNIVHDSSKPLTIKQQQSDQGLQQTRDQADGKVSLSQALINSNLQNRSGEQQYQQTANLNDLQAKATAPNATAIDQQNYLRAKDPAGLLKLQQSAPQVAAELAKTNAQTDSLKAATEKNARSIKALPTPLQKLEDDDLESIGSTNGINTQLQHFADQIHSGKLELSPTKNLDSVINHATGGTDENSRNYAAFKAGLVKLTNDSLRLNKGTQTEGDAQRASDEILNNLKDPNFVLQRLGEIQGLNTKAATVRTNVLNARRNSQGVAPLDVNAVLGIARQANQQQATPSQAATAAPAPNLPQISSEAGYQALPSGAQYIDPQGNHRSKP